MKISIQELCEINYISSEECCDVCNDFCNRKYGNSLKEYLKLKKETFIEIENENFMAQYIENKLMNNMKNVGK